MKANKNGVKLLAAFMALAMVFVAGFAIIGGNDSSVDAATGDNIKYFSGTLDGENIVPNGTIAYIDKDTKIITDSTDPSKIGSIIVQSGGYLKINEGVTLTIENASNITGISVDGVISGDSAGLVIEYGAYVVVEGSISVKSGATIYNESYVNFYGEPILKSVPGLSVPGKITVEKGAKIYADESGGEMFVTGTGSVEFKSTSVNQSVITNQGICMDAEASVKIDAAVEGISAIGTYNGNEKGIFTYVVISDQKTAASEFTDYENIFVRYGETPDYISSGTVNLKFSVSSEKAGKIWDTDAVSNKYTYYNLDISGTVGYGAALLSAGNVADENLTSLNSKGDGSSGYRLFAANQITDSLKVTKGGCFATSGLSKLVVSGTIDIDGSKGTPAIVYLAGIHYITGTANIGKVSLADLSNPVSAENASNMVVNFGIHDDAYFIVEGEGSVNIEEYAVPEGYSNCPAGVLGVYYIDDDKVFHIVSDLQAAIDAVVAEDNSELTISSFNAYGHYLKATQYKITSTITIPEGLEISLYNVLSVDKTATLVLSEGAEFISIGGQAGLISVSGYFYDYNTATMGYMKDWSTPATDGKVYVSAEVMSVDDDETYYLYTSLKNALGDEGKRTIKLFGDVSVSETLTIPADVTLDIGDLDLVINADSELIVDGIILTEGDGIIDLKVETDKKDGKLTVNNIIMDVDVKKGGVTSPVAGIYANGTIGDLDGEFILAPAVAAQNSKTIGDLEIRAETRYTGALTFTADDDANDATIDILSKAVFGEITLVGYTIINNNDGTTTAGEITATIKAETTSGVASVKLDKVTTDGITFSLEEDDSGDEAVTMFTIKANDDLAGNMSIISGTAYLSGTLNVGACDAANKTKAIMTVGSDAKFVVPEGSKLVVLDKTLGINMDDYAGLVVDGELSIVKGTLSAKPSDNSTPGAETLAGIILVNGKLSISKITVTIDGTVQVLGAVEIATGTDKGTLKIGGDLIIGEASETLGVGTSISGTVELVDTSAFITAYPGVDLTAAVINPDEEGESTAIKTDYFINGILYMNTYALTGTDIIDMIPETITITGYQSVSNDQWYVIPEMDDANKLLVDGDKVEDYSAVYAKALPSTAWIKVSVGTGISLYIDGVNYTTGDSFMMNVGEYNVETIVDPGYKGTTKITFNGTEITNGKMIITPQMSVSSTEMAPVILSATGQISIDSGDTPTPTPTPEPETKDDGMALTDILLIVLVILAAILVIVVAVRMMRS